MTVCRGRLVALLLIAGGVLACGEDTPVPRLECLSTTLEAQPLRRVPVGTTHYLPTLDPTCGEHEWRLALGTKGSVVLVHHSFLAKTAELFPEGRAAQISSPKDCGFWRADTGCLPMLLDFHHRRPVKIRWTLVCRWRVPIALVSMPLCACAPCCAAEC